MQFTLSAKSKTMPSSASTVGHSKVRMQSVLSSESSVLMPPTIPCTISLQTTVVEISAGNNLAATAITTLNTRCQRAVAEVASTEVVCSDKGAAIKTTKEIINNSLEETISNLIMSKTTKEQEEVTIMDMAASSSSRINTTSRNSKE